MNRGGGAAGTAPNPSVGRALARACALTLFPLLAFAASLPVRAQLLPSHGGENSGYIGTSGTAERTAKIARLMRALTAGKASQVEHLAGQLKLNRVSRRLLGAQLNYDMPTLLAAAKACRDDAFSKSLLSAALRCNALGFGAATSLGNAKALLAFLSWAQTKGYPRFARAHNGKFPISSRNFDQVDVPQIAKSVQPLRIQLDTASRSMPIVNWSRETPDHAADVGVSDWTAPEVSVAINGHHALAVVDTGDPLPLVIGASRARALGVKVLLGGFTALPEPHKVPPLPGDAKLGVILTFQFGPLVIHNLAVRIIPDMYAAKGLVVGLPILARFKRVTFTDSHILVNASTLACHQALRETYAASGTRELGHLLFPVKIRGVHATAMFDTGSEDLLLAKPTFANDARALSAAPSDSYAHGHLRISMPNGQIASTAAAFYSVLPADVLIGEPLLGTADVEMGFSPPTVCIRGKQ